MIHFIARFAGAIALLLTLYSCVKDTDFDQFDQTILEPVVDLNLVFWEVTANAFNNPNANLPLGTVRDTTEIRFLDDPDTDGIVLIGEIGGTAEIDGADFIKSWNKTKKPVAAFVAGAAAPKGRKLGHAGAIVNSGAETADAKKEALRSAGVEVSDTITRIGDAMRKAMGVK